MKVVFLSESSWDEIAVHILVEAVWESPIEHFQPEEFQARPGGHGREKLFPALFRHVLYQTDADALVVVFDTDNKPIHKPTHENPGAFDADCRLCRLRQKRDELEKTLKPRPFGNPLRVALGTASPCLEAWYLHGINSHVGEVEWERTLKSKQYSQKFGIDLKRQVYGTDRPSDEIRARRTSEEARRLADLLPDFEAMFPGGFGALAREVRSWRK